MKVVFLIMSGDEKLGLALRMAYNSAKNKRYDDIKLLFFGPSQKSLTTLQGDLKNMFEQLLKDGVVDSACVGVAENMGLKDPLLQMGLRLTPMGETLSKYVNQGYEVITF
ncbi:MAG: DsrE family protein [Metallosphaera sp.]